MSGGSSVSAEFRTLQAIADLRYVARGATPTQRARIVAAPPGGPGVEVLDHLIDAAGCRMVSDSHDRLLPALELSAATPDEDFGTFCRATAILLANRLQDGIAGEDLHWHWDAFAAQYDTADPVIRAALLHGYANGAATGRVTAEAAGAADGVTTRPDEAVARAIAAAQPTLPTGRIVDRLLSRLATALGDPAAARDAAWIWAGSAADILAADPVPRSTICIGFRHLYESDPGWTPFPGTRFDLAQPWPPVLPVIE